MGIRWELACLAVGDTPASGKPRRDISANIGLPREGRAVGGSANGTRAVRLSAAVRVRGAREVMPGARSGATQLQFPQLGFA